MPNPAQINFSVGQQFDLQCLQNNDYILSYNANAVNLQGLSQDNYVLTGAILTFYLKATSSAPDATAYINTPSVTNATFGLFSVNIPRAQLAEPGTLFYHIDSIAGGVLTTLVFGNVYVVPI